MALTNHYYKVLKAALLDKDKNAGGVYAPNKVTDPDATASGFNYANLITLLASLYSERNAADTVCNGQSDFRIAEGSKYNFREINTALAAVPAFQEEITACAAHGITCTCNDRAAACTCNDRTPTTCSCNSVCVAVTLCSCNTVCSNNSQACVCNANYKCNCDYDAGCYCNVVCSSQYLCGCESVECTARNGCSGEYFSCGSDANLGLTNCICERVTSGSGTSECACVTYRAMVLDCTCNTQCTYQSSACSCQSNCTAVTMGCDSQVLACIALGYVPACTALDRKCACEGREHRIIFT